MRVAVTGSSGFIGSALVGALRADGHSVVPLVRRPPRSGDEVRWDPAAGELDAAGLAGVEAAVHLAGANVGHHRWTDAYKRTIRDSRVQGTTLLSEALAGLDPRPRVLLSASGMSYYGDTGDETVDETSPAGKGFLAQVTQDWEASTAVAGKAGIRVCHLRSGLVLSGRGGALARQLMLFRLGLGGRLGSGHQWWSWISLDDEIGAIRFLLGADPTPSDRAGVVLRGRDAAPGSGGRRPTDVKGPVNLVSPQPVTNAMFTAALASALHRPAVFPVPAFALRVVLGEFASEVLESRRLLPGVLTRAGYRFAHPTIGPALGAAAATRR